MEESGTGLRIGIDVGGTFTNSYFRRFRHTPTRDLIRRHQPTSWANYPLLWYVEITDASCKADFSALEWTGVSSWSLALRLRFAVSFSGVSLFSFVQRVMTDAEGRRRS
ncbi:MAG: hypothetical protein OXU75_08860, partial [Deltaproteobacteria bacterium]|nr:hypothetical protein [Deltaproteobacteria bacterium]